MPVRNEGAFIRRAVAAVLAQDYPADRMEVLVADGLSTDGTGEYVRRLCDRHPHLRVIDNPGKIVSTGLNAAISQARGDIVVRVDGHCEIESDYVRRAVAHLLTGAADAVGGPLRTLGETPCARVIAAAMSTPFGVGNAAFRTTHDRTALTDTVAFPAYTRSILSSAGPFDEELVRNQDDEYSYRLRALGARILLAADVKAHYYSRGTLRTLWRQYAQYGYWKVRVLQKHPRQMRPRQFVPPAFVAALVLSALSAMVSAAGMWLFAAVSGSYLAANGAVSIVVGRRRGWRSIPLLALTFAVLHVAYGTGFLVGLVKFWNRWGDRGRPLARLKTAPDLQ
jgi:glycosyltransferase involved in cell wall biosynthesis